MRPGTALSPNFPQELTCAAALHTRATVSVPNAARAKVQPMAKVYLQSDGGKTIDNLPMVCIKCGAPATVRKSKKFTWISPEARRLGWWLPLILDLIVMSKQT